MTNVRTAIVAGGGIAGTVTAMALQRAGIAATVFEAYPSPADGVGGDLTIAPNGLRALGAIGADEAVREVGVPTPRMVMQTHRGRRLAEFDCFPELPVNLTLPRAALHRTLRDLAVSRGIEVKTGKRLASAKRAGDGVRARFDDDSSVEAEILVGADGIRSTVRTLIDPRAPEPAYTGLLGFGGVVERSGLPSTDGAQCLTFGKRAFFGYQIDDVGEVRWFANVPHAEPMTTEQARATSADEWLRRLRELYAEDTPAADIVGLAAEKDLVVAGPLEILPPVPRWHGERMVLVGDSAHAPSASSGQGASLAAESAVQLAICLRDAPTAEQAFLAYEEIRRPRVTRIAANAARSNSGKAAGPIGRALLGAAMPILFKTVMTPEKMFGWIHRHHVDWDRPSG